MLLAANGRSPQASFQFPVIALKTHRHQLLELGCGARRTAFRLVLCMHHLEAYTSTTAWPAASAQKKCMGAPPSAWSGLNVPSSKSRESSGREGNRVNESANSDKSSQLTSELLTCPL